MKITTTVIIRKPIETVWNYFNQPENMLLWLEDLVHFEMVEGQRGTVGAKAKLTYHMRGMTIEMLETTTEVKPMTSMSAILAHSDMTSLLETLFRAVDEQTTEITAHTVVTFHSFFFKMGKSIIIPEMEKKMRHDFDTLKTLLESAAG